MNLRYRLDGSAAVRLLIPCALIPGNTFSTRGREAFPGDYGQRGWVDSSDLRYRCRHRNLDHRRGSEPMAEPIYDPDPERSPTCSAVSFNSLALRLERIV